MERKTKTGKVGYAIMMLSGEQKDKRMTAVIASEGEKGLWMRLQFWKGWGILWIYLNPIFASTSNHKYNTNDYYRIDEGFGDEAELVALVKEAHEAGIRIMLDAVFNHCGTEFAPWADVLENGRESRYFDWFFIHQFPFDQKSYDTRDKKYDSFAFAAGMPKLNTNNPKVINYFKELCTFWLTKWDIDGIRFDVGNEISHFFLKELRKALKTIKPDVYLLGEIWHDSIGWLMGDEYDSVMNYPLQQSINDFFIDPERTAIDFEHAINRCYSLYMKQTNRVLFNLLDSHDTERLSMRTGTEGKFYQQLAILFTMEGSPSIYYGTEIYMPGGYDPDCRRCMPWDEIEAGKYDAYLERMKQLIAMRKRYAACKSNEITWVHEKEQPRVIHYIKKTGSGQSLHVLLNAGTATLSLQDAREKSGLLEENIVFSSGFMEHELAPDGVMIWTEA